MSDMPMATEKNEARTLNTTREPVGVMTPGSKGSPGDRAVMDAVLVVLAAWAILLFLVWSLRRANV